MSEFNCLCFSLRLQTQRMDWAATPAMAQTSQTHWNVKVTRSSASLQKVIHGQLLIKIESTMQRQSCCFLMWMNNSSCLPPRLISSESFLQIPFLLSFFSGESSGTFKGCASQNLCDNSTLLNSALSRQVFKSSCCGANLCNNAQKMTQGPVLLLVPILSLLFYILDFF